MQPALSALQKWELVINGKVIREAESYAERFDFSLTASEEFNLPFQPHQAEWDMGGPYNYIGSNFSAFSMFSATRGIYTHHGRSSIRPLRRGMFRVNTYLHWPAEIPASALRRTCRREAKSRERCS